MIRFAGVLIAALIAMPHSACAPAMIASAGFGALQTGTEAFVRGELESAVEHPMSEVFEAVQRAMVQLDFKIRTAKLGEVNAYLVSREAQGRKIEIDLELKSSVVTKINIRVGVFGDQAISRLILSTIQSNILHAPIHLHSGPLP